MGLSTGSSFLQEVNAKADITSAKINSKDKKRFICNSFLAPMSKA